MEGRGGADKGDPALHHSSRDPLLFGKDIVYPPFVAPVIPGRSRIGEGTGVATADHQHNWWIYELAGAVSDAALVATGDFTQEELDEAEGGLLFFDTTTNTLYYRRSDGTYRTEAM